jgi:hypothetical protein
MVDLATPVALAALLGVCIALPVCCAEKLPAMFSPQPLTSRYATATLFGSDPNQMNWQVMRLFTPN